MEQSNVVPLKGSGREQYFPDDSPLYFETDEHQLYFYGSGGLLDNQITKVPTHKVITRKPATLGHYETPLGVVGTNYKVLPMKDLCHHVEDTFVECLTHEQLSSVKVWDEESFHGGRLIRSYVFPNIRADIQSRVSDIAFRTIIVNGYDGSSSVSFYSGAIDFFCSNGMVSGTYDLVVKRHTKGLTIPRLTNNLKKSIDIFYTNAETWKQWVRKEISDEDAKSVFEAMPNVSDRRVEQLMRQFHIECMTHGRTVWALYSAATYYASHDDGEFSVRDTGKDNAAHTLLLREKQVSSWVGTEEFRRIAA